MERNGKRKVVCVDDDPLVQARVAAALGGAYDVVEAPSGREGLKALYGSGADWVVLDYHLGDMNGGEFLLEAHQLGLRPAYILLSGSPISRLDWEGLRPLGVRGSLQKPLETDYLLALLAGLERHEGGSAAKDGEKGKSGKGVRG